MNIDMKTVDGTARSVASDLQSEEQKASVPDVLRTIDQKTEGTKVDPQDVEQKIRSEVPALDQELTEIEQKGIRDVVERFARRGRENLALWISELGQTPAEAEDRAEFISGVIQDIEIAQEEGELARDTASRVMRNLNTGNIQRAFELIQDDPKVEGTPGAVEEPDMFGKTDQKAEEEEEENEGGDPFEMLNDEATETAKKFAEMSDKSPGEVVEMMMSDDGEVDENDDYEDDMEVDEKAIEKAIEETVDQKFESMEGSITKSVVNTMTDDEVVSRMAGEVSQKMKSDEDFQEDLVDVVDQKGDFSRTPQGSSGSTGGSTPVGKAVLDGGEDE